MRSTPLPLALLAFLSSALSSGVVGCASAPAPVGRPEASAAPALPPLGSVAPPAPTTPTAPMAAEDGGAPVDMNQPADVKASNTFTAHLYARMRKAPGNVLVSGTSLRQALALAYLGARGETAREMATALELAAEPSRVATLSKAENAAWQDARGNAELFVANRLWIDQGFPVKSELMTLASTGFGASVAPVDFTNAPDVARRTINTWVASATAQKIPELLAEGGVDSRTRVVITNAAYFKGTWATTFPVSATKDEPFKAAKRVTVPTMHQTSSYRFAHVGGVKVLEMRYDTSELGLLVVLPDDAAGLGKVEDSFTADTFDIWTKALAMQRVAVAIPKFTFGAGGAVVSPLQELGMKTAFTAKADLTGIADAASGALVISRVVQKTWIAIDERGTEAAASTGVSMSTTSMPMGPVAELKADHPFLFFVYDAKRGRILFAGRMTDPKS